MKVQYNTLFRLRTTGAFVGGEMLDYLNIIPTQNCRVLLQKFKLLMRQLDKGIDVYYESDPGTGGVPRKAITQEQKFYFIASVKEEEFWFYADTPNWKQGYIFLLKNTGYKNPANVVMDVGANPPIRFTSPRFTYKTTAGVLKISDPSGAVVYESTVRANDNINIDLGGRPEGLYKIACGAVNETIFMSPDYNGNAIAVLEISYQTGAWTVNNKNQRFEVALKSRMMDWVYDVYLKPGLLAVDPSTLKILHVPAKGEALLTINQVAGSIPPEKNNVKFKSTAAVAQSKNPRTLKLLSGGKTLIDGLPMPSSRELKLNGTKPFISMIVNL
jgi:hypothetical protein